MDLGFRSSIAASLLFSAALLGCQNDSKMNHWNSGSTSSTPGVHVARTVDKAAKLEFFIMSKCPYGVQVEKAIAPVLAKLGDNVDFHLAYIGDKKGEELSSMHGPGRGRR